MSFPCSRILSLALMLALSGCAAEQWTKPGATPQQFDATRASCISSASAKFPPLMRPVPLGNGYVEPVRTSCTRQGPTETCAQSGGDYVPPDVIMVDDNQTARDQDVRACLYANGWQPVDN